MTYNPVQRGLANATLILVLAVSLSHCTTVNPSKFLPEAAPGSNGALAYVYWPKALKQTAGTTLSLQLDGVTRAPISMGTYWPLKTQPGRHTLTLVATDLATMTTAKIEEQQIDLLPARVVYFEYSPESKAANSYGLNWFGNRLSHLVPVPESVGLTALYQTSLSMPKAK